MNYRELWEGLRMFDGHRELKPYSAAPEKEYKTVKECVDNLEALSAQGNLAKMMRHRKRTRFWENG